MLSTTDSTLIYYENITSNLASITCFILRDVPLYACAQKNCVLNTTFKHNILLVFSNAVAKPQLLYLEVIIFLHHSFSWCFLFLPKRFLKAERGEKKCGTVKHRRLIRTPMLKENKKQGCKNLRFTARICYSVETVFSIEGDSVENMHIKSKRKSTKKGI